LIYEPARIFSNAKHYDNYLAPYSHKKHPYEKYNGRQYEKQNPQDSTSLETANNKDESPKYRKDNTDYEKNLNNTRCNEFRERQIEEQPD